MGPTGLVVDSQLGQSVWSVEPLRALGQYGVGHVEKYMLLIQFSKCDNTGGLPTDFSTLGTEPENLSGPGTTANDAGRQN